MTSPYLKQALVPLCVALRQMLENAEAELANAQVRPPEQERLRRRAELIRSLLTPSRIS